ncbi:MAG: hypothetical protein HC933_11100 [Pleurocapsa sp. SU_196_0]|nr:hypothetical protein [Pleurocapsa sp. SU_196_0]
MFAPPLNDDLGEKAFISGFTVAPLGDPAILIRVDYGDSMRKRLILATIAAVVIFGTATLAFAFPATVACALIEYAGLEVLPNGTRLQTSSTSTERKAIVDLEAQARTRIENVFGAPRAKPMVVFLNNPATIFTFRSNGYGSTHFVGSRACVIIGPEGTNVDVIAHELMHAELFDRLGPWRRSSQIPAWFDEGLAMQVDFRARYDSSRPVDTNELTELKKLKTIGQFYTGDSQDITRHYARSKRAVAQWLEHLGRSNMYSSLERIRNGESFETVFESNHSR